MARLLREEEGWPWVLVGGGGTLRGEVRGARRRRDWLGWLVVALAFAPRSLLHTLDREGSKYVIISCAGCMEEHIVAGKSSQV